MTAVMLPAKVFMSFCPENDSLKHKIYWFRRLASNLATMGLRRCVLLPTRKKLAMDVAAKLGVAPRLRVLLHEKPAQAGIVRDRECFKAGPERDSYIRSVVLLTVGINCGIFLAPVMRDETLAGNIGSEKLKCSAKFLP
jgi:hypothetical protein